MKCCVIRSIFVLVLSIAGKGLFAQLQLTATPHKIDFTPALFTPTSFLQNSTFESPQEKVSGRLPELYRVCDLPVFCRVEVKIEKAVSFPVKFRLGSVEHVDWLEGKGHDTYIDKQ